MSAYRTAAPAVADPPAKTPSEMSPSEFAEAFQRAFPPAHVCVWHGLTMPCALCAERAAYLDALFGGG